ncbi:MAG: hypothetical protein P4N60_22395 [Verrucomicrobiae bacterium]|nr:hypothetical protein [Verrucomicrobiae bacterium]
MSFFATIHDEASRRKLRFLVIGGLAVIHYGYSRETGDMDLLISKNDREDWLKFWLGRGYVCFHDGGVFIQLKPPDSHSWPVDLMMTPEETFANL